MSPFTPLRVRSHGSLLAGVVSPEALCERAAELGHAALGLTDIDNLYLAVRFLTAAKGAGLKPIVGAELTAPGGGNRALLIPFDRRGWASLCALLTARHLDDAFDLVRAIGGGHAGLHVIVESPGLAMALLAAGVPAAIAASEEVARARAHAGGGRRAGGWWCPRWPRATCGFATPATTRRTASPGPRRRASCWSACRARR